MENEELTRIIRVSHLVLNGPTAFIAFNSAGFEPQIYIYFRTLHITQKSFSIFALIWRRAWEPVYKGAPFMYLKESETKFKNIPGRVLCLQQRETKNGLLLVKTLFILWAYPWRQKHYSLHKRSERAEGKGCTTEKWRITLAFLDIVSCTISAT